MKTLKINVPEGYEIDKEQSTFENIVFKEIKKELPKSWEELEKLDGYYVGIHAELIRLTCPSLTRDDNRNIFATKEQAEASIVLAMYSQMLQAYKDVSVTEFIDIAKEYEPKVRPILELFFGEYAEAAFYYGLLGKLRDEYRQGWIPDWENETQQKWCIRFKKEAILINLCSHINYFLSFQSEEIAEQFLENFRELIEKAKPLMS